MSGNVNVCIGSLDFSLGSVVVFILFVQLFDFCVAI